MNRPLLSEQQLNAVSSTLYARGEALGYTEAGARWFVDDALPFYLTESGDDLAKAVAATMRSLISYRKHYLAGTPGMNRELFAD